MGSSASFSCCPGASGSQQVPCQPNDIDTRSTDHPSHHRHRSKCCEPGFLSSATNHSRVHGTTPKPSSKYFRIKHYTPVEQERCYGHISQGSCSVLEARSILASYLTQLGPNFYQDLPAPLIIHSILGPNSFTQNTLQKKDVKGPPLEQTHSDARPAPWG